MKTYIFTFLLVATLVSCSENETQNFQSYDLGDCKYYSSFLWSDEEIEYIDKTIVLDFNQDAKEEGSYAVLQFVDVDSKPLDMSEYEIMIDNKIISSPEFKVTSNQDSLNLKIRSLPVASSGVKTGYLKIKSGHTLDRVGQISLDNENAEAIILQWQFHYDKNWNIWATCLFWITILLVAALILWFLILKNLMIRHIPIGRYTINDPYYRSQRVKAAYRLIFRDKPEKQSALSRIFLGRSVVDVNPVWSSPLVFEGSKRGMRMLPNGDYSVSPYATVLIPNCEYTITNNQTRAKIKLILTK